MKKFVAYESGFKVRTFNTEAEMNAWLAKKNAEEATYTRTHAYYYGREEEVVEEKEEPMTLEEIETLGIKVWGEKQFEAKVAYYTELGHTREKALQYVGGSIQYYI